MNKSKALETMNSFGNNTMVAHLGIEITDFGDNYICGKMPVDNRTVQPYCMLHGGASAVLAETLGSIAGGMQVDRTSKTVVGVEINCNHLRIVNNGSVYGKATSVKIGKTIQVWNIEIKNDHGEMVAVSRLTLAVIDKR